jgi:hypothetical protein
LHLVQTDTPLTKGVDGEDERDLLGWGPIKLNGEEVEVTQEDLDKFNRLIQ